MNEEDCGSESQREGDFQGGGSSQGQGRLGEALALMTACVAKGSFHSQLSVSWG